MNKVVLITGASTGFGNEAALRFARRGHHVFATMRDAQGRNAQSRAELERVAKAEKLKLEVLELDVTNDDSVARAVDAALRQAVRHRFRGCGTRNL
jgi:NAD(P)-dependent dehydrogenase (short-subunit alcohol dehydrogenase family)